MTQVSRILRFSLVTADASRLADFYHSAFGCVRHAAGRTSASDGIANQISLALGEEIVELLQYEMPGAAYPADIAACDLRFQHLAIVVSDMAQAWQHLCSMDGWSAITAGPPQTLPASSGGVTAFKFRDLDGHPLELLEFPKGHIPPKWRDARAPGMGLGIDHSAICVLNTDASTAFYETMGLEKRTGSDNRGPAQNALDGLDQVQVAVTPLMPPQPAPHLELLRYRETTLASAPMAYNDVACTKTVLQAARSSLLPLTDPDGHHVIILPASEPSFPFPASGANT